MRQLTEADRIRQLIRALGAEADQTARLYFTGGATAVLMGWRKTTIDVDLRIFPESDRLLRAIPPLKEKLQMNIELACPADFIPELPGWEERSLYISTEGRIAFYHYDFYAQALAKIERGHAQDLQDVHAMIDRGLIEPKKTQYYFNEIEPLLYPHNIIFNFWLEIGLAGLLAFGWTIALFFNAGFSQLRRGDWLTLGMMAAMVVILVHGLVDVPYFKNDLAALFWVVVGLLPGKENVKYKI